MERGWTRGQIDGGSGWLRLQLRTHQHVLVACQINSMYGNFSWGWSSSSVKVLDHNKHHSMDGRKNEAV